MSTPELSRRAFLQGSVVAGIGITLAPLGSKAFAALFEEQVTRTPEPWYTPGGQARGRIEPKPETFRRSHG